MAIKVKKKSGRVVQYPITKVKNMLKTVGFSGVLLIKATGQVFKEAKKFTKSGVITATNFEKSIIRAVSNTNNIAVNTTQKITRRVLR